MLITSLTDLKRRNRHHGRLAATFALIEARRFIQTVLNKNKIQPTVYKLGGSFIICPTAPTNPNRLNQLAQDLTVLEPELPLITSAFTKPQPLETLIASHHLDERKQFPTIPDLDLAHRLANQRPEQVRTTWQLANIDSLTQTIIMAPFPQI